ncbi:MAG TPA: malto-oligosyltrehalose trehalohydrolase [Alphaproteobacteria bacterium]|nr:malto-oligosyltrehalose trehalohydrolase [Alphaproteobacteria bacterium]
MRYAHELPFGATCLGDGRVRFRLWAPSQKNVGLVLDSASSVLPMQAAGNGWFELTTDRTAPGDLYRYELAGGQRVPDPASRRQHHDVHGASVVVDPRAYEWRQGDWRGRPWHEAVLYELHVGTFSPSGDFAGVRDKLKVLAEQGITAVELMPIADFPGRWNWGYDGVLPYAPDASYGTPDDLKALIEAAHDLGLMIFLDVVYNHFGPDGNYLHAYAPQFFTERRRTPWGAAIDYAQRPVRDFFIHNALYWLNEYRFDGLRFDAVHEIVDDSTPTVLQELAETVRSSLDSGRHVHLVLENDDNAASLLVRNAVSVPRYYTAQWNDDFHHAAHAVATGESSGYYADYADAPVRRLGRALAEGFIYQGERSEYRDRPRGEASRNLPPAAFVDFIQNHDQVGNRAFGDRLTALAPPEAVAALQAVFLLAPAVPLLFMGEEYGATEPFCFFADFTGPLADAVRNGRRNEFARFADFADPAARERIPDPTAESTYRASKLDWDKRAEARHRDWAARTRAILDVRRREIAPRFARMYGGAAHADLAEPALLSVRWAHDDATLQLVAQLAGSPSQASDLAVRGRCIWSTHPEIARHQPLGSLPPWFVGWFVDGRR